MARAGNQTMIGKAFEYACASAICQEYETDQNVLLEQSPQLETAKKCFEEAGSKQADLFSAAKAAVRALDGLEPRLRYHAGKDPLCVSLQSDSAGMRGDVRDVLCTRRDIEWEIGLSCKHNHHAVKHSRLSDTIDFGDEWFGYPCSSTYFEEVRPIFGELRRLRDEGRRRQMPYRWADLPDKEGDCYAPILQSFIDELDRLAQAHPDVPQKLVEYLIGRHDFYKVISDDAHNSTRIEAVNISGALNNAAGAHKAVASVPLLKTPSRFYHMGFKDQNGKTYLNTIDVVGDNGWEISMRLHNASARIEPSLKFDVQLISFPSSLYSQVEPWTQRRSISISKP